jgi:trk system potassium uptake protein TrkA
VHVTTEWVGRPVSALEAAAGARVAFLSRFGDGIVPDEDTVVQDGDLVHVIMRMDETERIAEVFQTAPEVEV